MHCHHETPNQTLAKPNENMNYINYYQNLAEN